MGKIILLKILLGIWSLGSVSTVAADDWAVASELQETVKVVMQEIAAIKTVTSSAVTVEKPVLTKEPQMYKLENIDDEMESKVDKIIKDKIKDINYDKYSEILFKLKAKEEEYN